MGTPIAIEIGATLAKNEICPGRPTEPTLMANDTAIAAGVFGAPFFVVDGEPFWGNDRRAQIERWLATGPF